MLGGLYWGKFKHTFVLVSCKRSSCPTPKRPVLPPSQKEGQNNLLVSMLHDVCKHFQIMHLSKRRWELHVSLLDEFKKEIVKTEVLRVVAVTNRLKNRSLKSSGPVAESSGSFLTYLRVSIIRRNHLTPLLGLYC
jgi:hypothetical protein